jgi:ADP-ribosylglycohydrolase
MSKIQDKVKYMLLGTIIGDALGTPLDGLSRQHIKSTLKSINNYTDAAPALKGKLDQWKKPGLYSSASQLMILLAMYGILNKNITPNKFMQLIKTLPETAGNGYGIFRHPYPLIQHLIRNAKTNNYPALNAAFSGACAKSAIVLLPLAIPGILSDENYYKDFIALSLMLNKDTHSVAGSMIVNLLIRKILKDGLSENILLPAAVLANTLHKDLEILTPQLFELGVFPDYLLNAVNDFSNIFSAIKSIKDTDAAEKAIYSYVNKKVKTPITRANINYPLAIIPFSIYFCNIHLNNPSEILFHAAELGGSPSVICAMAGAFSGAIHGLDGIAENLPEELINKKRIINLAEAISVGKISDEIVPDFLQNEAALTSKEIQEKNAKLKHVKIKTKKPKSRQEKERQLSAHVVESWTKLDKARWRKKSKKNPHFKDDQLYNEDDS